MRKKEIGWERWRDRDRQTGGYGYIDVLLDTHEKRDRVKVSDER